MGHSLCQYRIILACCLNPSDDLRDHLILIILFSTDRAGGAPLFILQKLCAHQVLSDVLPCIIWGCGPLWIFKVTGDIWYISSIFICASSPSVTFSDVDSSTLSTSYSLSSALTFFTEMSTSSTDMVSMSSSINTALSEAVWWRVGRWVDYCNHCRQVSGFFDKCGRLWWPTDVNFCLKFCIWWHSVVYYMLDHFIPIDQNTIFLQHV